MKVFVVQIDNGQEYSDYADWIDGIFKSFRSASKHLIDKGFIPYAIKNQLGEFILNFENPKVSGAVNQTAWITKFELND
ncbi:hypothetical protein J1P26_19910 [Neobacillus sp. MM2021_6]|uniref:hypothetical protein n=1 Tax=Bacillaceae TaxID=186817 RepID=UPI0014077C7A|nr:MULTISPECIES: hypothetical protein [Bacillaceae]MBO0961974.1 hypothetical protein [Neobacillus sp. MM2021_6]NHC20329.1 hypothetical protein [Bacillus sp. MM2020_4]